MSNYSELRILTDDSNLFNEHSVHYIIPLYQRAYAWSDVEIIQLIDDINDIKVDEHSNLYYLGTLIVYRRNNGDYEVIDGQQRLTTLFLLLNSLPNLTVNCSLSFECRDKSNYTLENILNLNEKDKDSLKQEIVSGKNIIEKELSSDRIVNFTNKLKRVCLYRVEVPEHTDLNRYFEIMNTRGEQLEQQDIVKADLMRNITDPKKQLMFAEIWDACSDMTGYVQMHFSVSNSNEKYNSSRDILFGSSWENFPDNKKIENLQYLQQIEDSSSYSFLEIISDTFSVIKTDGYNEENDRIRFESIIDFRFFLLHVLHIYVADKKIVDKNQGQILEELLDDKKLRMSFQKVINDGFQNGEKINKNDFSLEFIKCLLQVRFLFDKYIVKREFLNENSEGSWSLKELKCSQKKAYYSNTKFNKYRELESNYARRNEMILMLESCLRVSYTSPKVMHWITNVLLWLYEQKQKNLEKLDEFTEILKDISRSAVKQQFFTDCQFDLGVNTPHIVFNYLDYLLWEKDKNSNHNKYKDFSFEFRNSVEHWYPQHPTEGTFQEWSVEDGLNNFGNLCIISRSINSKFSNMAPEAKKTTFKDMIACGSLKLRIMAEKTSDSLVWKKETFKIHSNEMIDILKDDCGVSGNFNE